MSAFLTLTALVVLVGSPIVLPLAGALGRAAARRTGGHQ
jgi:hypothetical protein